MSLNERLLPKEYYALAEQQGAELRTGRTDTQGPRLVRADRRWSSSRSTASGLQSGNGARAASGGVVVADPRVRVTAETDLEFYRRKQNVVAVRHVSGDQLIAVAEIVSRGNKSGRKVFDDFVRKAAEFLSRQVHLLILDPQPPTARSPGDSRGDLG